VSSWPPAVTVVDPSTAWAETPDSRPLDKGIYRHPSGWRCHINCVVHIPGIGPCQRAITKVFARDTPVETMQAWRKEKSRREAELRALIDNTLRARELDLRRRLEERDREVASLKAIIKHQPAKAEIAALRQRLEASEARARSLEEAARRAYAGFAGGGRR
jgi:hypothetical protein